MNKVTIALATTFLVFATQAMGQGVPGKVGDAVNGVGAAASQAASGVAGGGLSNGFDLSAGSNVGGEVPGGLGVKMGKKVIQLRGAVGVGDNSSNAKAGIGIPF
jgi:hypothetical protein